MLTADQTKEILPKQIYRKFLLGTVVWPGERVREGSLLIKVHDCKNASASPILWFGGADEVANVVSFFGENRTIYAVQTLYNVVPTTDENIELLSNYFAEEIKNTIESESYTIVSYCLAGFLAIAVANKMTPRGMKVDYLGIVDRDVTDRDTTLDIVRLVFRVFDITGSLFNKVGAGLQSPIKTNKLKRYYGSLFTIYYAVILYGIELKNIAQSGYQLLPFAKTTQLTAVENASIEDVFDYYKGKFNIMSTHHKLHLVFVRWGIFGFYQFRFFHKYWEKYAVNGLVVDTIFGCSHLHANWLKVLKKMNDQMESSS